ncbi:MAG: TIGR02186 family protein [Pseudomonadota bacterium]
MTRPLRCLFLVSAWMFQIPSWADEPLIVALEPAQVDVSADFTGIAVRAIGSMKGPGDLIVKVAGPPQDVTLSRKTKLGPFWVGGAAVKMRGAPSLLFLCVTAPIASVLPPAERGKYALLLEGVPVRIEPQLQAHAAGVWRKAFFQLKEKEGYYREDNGAIRVFENGQFVAAIRLPGDVQSGTYTVETLLVRSGKVVGRTVAEFKVRLVGMAYWIWSAAHDYPWLFGSLFTLAAMLLGIALTAIPYRSR